MGIKNVLNILVLSFSKSRKDGLRTLLGMGQGLKDMVGETNP